MENSIFNKRQVPVMHPGCSLAETGAAEFDDFDNPLKPLDIVPVGTDILVEMESVWESFDGRHVEVYLKLPEGIENPSSVRQESHEIVVVPLGVHPVTFLKEKGVDITTAWVFMHEEVVKTLRKLPCRFHQKTVAYGEFFRFEDFDTMSLQEVEYFPKWRVVYEGEINEKRFHRNDTPERIIEVVMEK